MIHFESLMKEDPIFNCRVVYFVHNLSVKMTFYALIRGFHQSNNYTSCLFQTGRELFDEGDKMEIMDMYAPCYCVTKAISQ